MMIITYVKLTLFHDEVFFCHDDCFFKLQDPTLVVN
jgi:hypothetical protein